MDQKSILFKLTHCRLAWGSNLNIFCSVRREGGKNLKALDFQVHWTKTWSLLARWWSWWGMEHATDPWFRPIPFGGSKKFKVRRTQSEFRSTHQWRTLYHREVHPEINNRSADNWQLNWVWDSNNASDSFTKILQIWPKKVSIISILGTLCVKRQNLNICSSSESVIFSACSLS
jgi:hypothetical protein